MYVLIHLFILFLYVYIADCIVYAASRPTNVVISVLEVLPNAQADMTTVHSSNNNNVFSLLEKKSSD